MARKEINVFGVAFLDLMSGAFAAVLILFIIVPKMSLSDQDALETLDDLELEATELEDMISQLENSVPDSLFNAIMDQMQQMEDRISNLNTQVTQVTNELATVSEENRQLENALLQAEQELAQVRETLEDAQQQLDNRPTEEDLAELQEQLEEAESEVSEATQVMEERREESAQGGGGPGASMFGVNAKFAVVCDWTEDVDVDLYLKDVSTNEWIHYQRTSDVFGKYLGDVTSRSADDGLFEMVYQAEVVPGTYEVWYHLYSEQGSAVVDGYAVLYPFSPQEQKFKFDTHTIQHTDRPLNGAGLKVGTITLTENRLTVN